MNYFLNKTESTPFSSSIITVFTVFRLLTDFVCLYTYEFWLSLCKIVRSSVILLLPLLNIFFCYACLILCRVNSVLCICPWIFSLCDFENSYFNYLPKLLRKRSLYQHTMKPAIKNHSNSGLYVFTSKDAGVTYSFFPLLIFPPGKISIY